MNTNRTPGAAALLAAALILATGAFTACSKSNNNTSTPATQPTPPSPSGRGAGGEGLPQANAALTLPAYARHGTEMSEFSTFVSKSFSKFNNSYKDYKKGTLAILFLPLIGATLTPVSYDALISANPAADNKSGKLMLSGWDATRTRSGNEIRGAATHANPRGFDDGANLVNSCVLDMKTNTLVDITTVTRNGKVIRREVTEARIAPDKTVYAQCLTANDNSGGSSAGGVTVSVYYYQMNADKDLLKVISGKMQKPTADFTHESFAGKDAIDIDALAAQALPAPRQTVTIKDGKVDESSE